MSLQRPPPGEAALCCQLIVPALCEAGHGSQQLPVCSLKHHQGARVAPHTARGSVMCHVSIPPMWKMPLFHVSFRKLKEDALVSVGMISYTGRASSFPDFIPEDVLCCCVWSQAGSCTETAPGESPWTSQAPAQPEHAAAGLTGRATEVQFPCAGEPFCLTPVKGKEGSSLGEAAENRQFWLHCEGSRQRAVRKRRAGIEQEREGFVHRKARVSDRKQLKCLFFSPDRWRLYRWRRLHCS